jgi:hypothetical protein
MKTRMTIWMTALAAIIISAGCSRPKSEPVHNVAAPTPNLRRDAELLREATNKAAEARKREEAAAAAKAAGVSISPAVTAIPPGTPAP